MQFNHNKLNLQEIINSTHFVDIANISRGAPEKIWNLIDEANNLANQQNKNIEESVALIYFHILIKCEIISIKNINLNIDNESGTITVNFVNEYSKALIDFDNTEKEYQNKDQLIEAIIDDLVYDTDIVKSKLHLAESIIAYRNSEDIEINYKLGKHQLYDLIKQHFIKHNNNILDIIWSAYDTFYKN